MTADTGNVLRGISRNRSEPERVPYRLADESASVGETGESACCQRCDLMKARQRFGAVALHHFCSGFDAFRARRAREFLEKTNRRELAINKRLFAGDPDPFRPVD